MQHHRVKARLFEILYNFKICVEKQQINYREVQALEIFTITAEILARSLANFHCQ